MKACSGMRKGLLIVYCLVRDSENWFILDVQTSHVQNTDNIYAISLLKTWHFINR